MFESLLGTRRLTRLIVWICRYVRLRSWATFTGAVFLPPSLVWALPFDGVDVGRVSAVAIATVQVWGCWSFQRCVVIAIRSRAGRCTMAESRNALKFSPSRAARRCTKFGRTWASFAQLRSWWEMGFSDLKRRFNRLEIARTKFLNKIESISKKEYVTFDLPR